MRKLLLAALFIVTMGFSCDKNSGSDDNEPTSSGAGETKCGVYNGHQLYTGPRGGCYYYNSNNNKVYVDRYRCNC